LNAQANTPFAPPSDALAAQSFIPPASLAPSTTPPTFSAQPDPINPLLATLALPPFDLFSRYRGSARSPLGAAWLPPTFPDAFGRTPPPLPMPPPAPFPPGSVLGDSAWGVAQGRGTTPAFGGSPFTSPTIPPQPTSSLQASGPSLATTYRQAALPFTAPNPNPNPGDNSFYGYLYSYLRNNLSYSNSGALPQSHLRTNDAPDAVSDTGVDSGDPSLILVGSSEGEEEQRKREQQKRGRDREIFNERAFGVTPPLGNTAPRLLPPLGGNRAQPPTAPVSGTPAPNPSREPPFKPALPPGIGPGPYAGEPIPAGPGARPSPSQQDQINASGDENGCHTCGAKNPGTPSGHWIGDHQDPTALNPPGQRQYYLPHCRFCSLRQGGLIRHYLRRYK